MTPVSRALVLGVFSVALAAARLAAAQPPASQESQTSERLVIISQKHYIRTGSVEITNKDTAIFAEQVEFFQDEDRALATGNVLMVQGPNRISAERVEFNTKTMLGTFYHASGIAQVQPQRQTRSSGIAPPPIVGQETVVYFFGETVEKIGPKKYKISKGGFSTCVQPTPRWEMSADTVILNVDHYTVLRNAVMSVKGVPLLYLPIIYYPTKRDNRATGFLLPTYGSSSLRGQSIHNAFFWAIDRSQDATIMHDWFSKTGQGIGSEYRYNFGPGDGNFRTYFLNQHATAYTLPDGDLQPLPASRSYEVRGGANQILPGNFRARARVDYFSSIQTSQTFNTNIYDISRNQRTYGGNVVGGFGTYTVNGTLDHSEYFYNKTESVVSGSWPRVAVNRNERPIGSSPLYFSLGTEFAHLLRETRDDDVRDNRSLSRVDFWPQIRYPFKKWQWFTVNSTLGWRDTYYTRSLAATGDPLVPPSKVVDEPFNRRFFSLQASVLGPVFNRIWDTPANGYAEKFKHSIEPFVTIQKTSTIENFDRVIQYDGIDSYVGGTQYAYGINNRFYAKRKLTPGAQAQSREIFDVELVQTYYTNQRASQYDRQYQTNATTTGDTRPTHFSPIALSIRALPTNDLNATVRAEFDSRYKSLRTISATGTVSTWDGRVQTTGGWSKRAFIAELTGFNDPRSLDHFVNTSSTVRTKDNRLGTTYSIYYDVLRSSLTQQRVTGFYNAQCCGIAFEYQAYNYGAGSFSPLPSDHRFFMSFTLAGLGNFSPFNGALSGVPR